MLIQRPHIAIIATGGTIAGSATDCTNLTEYTVGALTIEDLLAAVPQIADYAIVKSEQLCQLDSSDLTTAIWLQLAHRVNILAADPAIQGIVITHGTDTLEETAYFLNLVVKTLKPVILVGAMRPATALSADGPLNLLNAIRLAADSRAVANGVLVIMNDLIITARSVSKTTTTRVDAFQAPDFGVIGCINNGKPSFYTQPLRRHTINSEFSTTDLASLPYVKIIYGHVDDDRLLIDAAANAGVKGIVYAGLGNGSIPAAARAGLVEAAHRGIVIVRSSRTGSGIVSTTADDELFIAADNLSPQKARILLMLALTTTCDHSTIQNMFEEY